MDENARNRLIWELQTALHDLQKTVLERDIMFRYVHSQGVIQSLLLVMAISSDDEEVKTLLEQINEAWGKAIVGKRDNQA